MCRLMELRNKEVINLRDGYRMGYVGDCDISLEEGKICNIIVPGRWRFFGLFGREDDFVIPWEDVKKIGDDIILVEYDIPFRYYKKKHIGRAE